MDQFPQIVAVHVLRSRGFHLNLSHRDENLRFGFITTTGNVVRATLELVKRGQVSSEVPRAA